jgi:hypothetical protein
MAEYEMSCLNCGTTLVNGVCPRCQGAAPVDPTHTREQVTRAAQPEYYGATDRWGVYSVDGQSTWFAHTALAIVTTLGVVFYTILAIFLGLVCLGGLAGAVYLTVTVTPFALLLLFPAAAAGFGLLGIVVGAKILAKGRQNVSTPRTGPGLPPPPTQYPRL